MGNCPEACCFRNVKIVNDYPVQIYSDQENAKYNSYLTQPNYSSLIFLQTRIKRFLNNKAYNTNEKLASNLIYNQNNNIKTSSNLVVVNTLQKESTGKFNTNFRQQSTDKEEYYENNYQKNINNKVYFIEEQKINFPKIIMNKGSNMFQEDLFSKQDSKNNKDNKDPRNGPHDGKRRKYPILSQDIFSYEGEWKNGKRDGLGILIKKDVAKFIGQFVEDQVNGFGILIDDNGDEYKGYWKKSKAHGLGIYNKKGIISYKGKWKLDKQNGFGIEKWPQLEYIGEYLNGNKEGYGVLNIRDGIYEGQMKDGNINGVGSFVFKDKRKYQGEFVNNKIEGYGILTWPDGKVFVGGFKDDLEDGFGIFYTSKKIYIGFWQNMILGGEVIIIEGDKKRKQLWEQGKCYKNLPQNYDIKFEKYVDEIIKEKDFYMK